MRGLYLAMVVLVLLGSCKKASEFRPLGQSLGSIETTTEELGPDLEERKIVVDVAPQSVGPNLKNDKPLAPLAGPTDFPQPFIPAVPPDAYGEDDLEGFLPSARILAVPFSVCGNGVAEPREQCDDGNFDNQDGCNVLCLFPICGNGLLEANEECDDNNNISGDGCTQDCIYERCGNGRIDKLPFKDDAGSDVYEECDDGNHKAGDTCSPCCLFEMCGNSIIDPDEDCDDGNTTSGDGCSSWCKFETAISS